MPADPNHLEKMGRELKCPICLSLFNSAVSLHCNHVFCNSCIVKSMKSDSNCPVCKVPYHRREVRPAPHMDNLVSIYKSMEISSGMNIFVTQNAPSTKLSDGKLQAEDCNIHDRQDSGEPFGEKHDSFGERMSQENSVHVKPSFPTKKRVQVRPTQSEDGLGIDKLSGKNSKIIKSDTNEQGRPALSPFFWLRDEENFESLSQLSAKSPFSDTPYPDVPTFSDIKDSDDENSSRLTPDREEVGKSSNLADMLDSEMFEWTQRACSPELCSSPRNKKQVSNIDANQEKNLKEAANHKKRGKMLRAGNVKLTNTNKDNGCINELLNISLLGTDNFSDQTGSSKSMKRGRKTREMVGTGCLEKNANLTFEINTVLDKGAQDLPKVCKWNKKVRLSDIAAKPAHQSVCAAIGAETPDDHNKSLATEYPGSVGKKRKCSANNISKSTGKNSEKIHSKGLDTQENDSGETSNEKSLIGNDTIAHLSALFVPLANKDKASESVDKHGKLTKKCKASDGLKSKRKSSISSTEEKAGLLANEARGTEIIKDNIDTGNLVDPLTVKKLPLTNDATLKRCENNIGKSQCVFCLSSEESEASGEMIHYLNGRPVASDHNAGSKVIHSHRNCTEWAPNVYFEDEVAINLEAEITRSRRIKCSCCGIKGASLGCYDKSCRKSFHVPCAKLMPQCRWDMENFVMLCPLHPSYTFPSEGSKSQARKTKRNTNRLSSVQNKNVVVKHDLGTSPNWSSCGFSKKIVLCCSALTNSEREIVSEFERISGVMVSKKWESNVTHVIASTDENGACKRTLKVLMGILGGKWILSIKWIQACIEAQKQVEEECFEITIDTHGIVDGPEHGRLRVQNKLPKLFEGFNFYVMGDFVASYKGYLQDLISSAGGTILHRKPISGTCQTFIIYSLELSDQCELSKMNAIFDRRRLDAEALAGLSGAKVVSNTWVLNSIAACKLQSLTE